MNDLKRRYGLTVEEWDEIYAKQKGLCVICHDKPTDTLNVDHDHETGKVRGLLCRSCNTALGLFKDDPELISRAALYVARHQGGDR